MIVFYIIALLPAVAGYFLWLCSVRINWIEWASATAGGFILSAIFHGVILTGLTDDVQTLSGQIVTARQFSAWKEYYEEAVYRTEYYEEEETYTDSNGDTQTRTVTKSRQVFDHWEPEERWHEAYWQTYSNLGQTFSISEVEFKDYVKKFRDRTPTAGVRTTGEHNSRMIEGDPNDYVAYNKTGYIVPVTALVRWSNKVKAAPSVFSFASVSTNAPVFNWPENPSPFQSQRLLGTAARTIGQLEFDQLCAVAGPSKKVNLIVVGFGNRDSSVAHQQEAKWIGGKKNDLVICYGGDDSLHPSWVYVFGWTESALVKRNLETIFLQNACDNTILPKIQEEVNLNYKLKDWSKFNYISIEPPPSSYAWFTIILIVVETGIYVWCWKNEFSKEPKLKTKTRYVYR